MVSKERKESRYIKENSSMSPTCTQGLVTGTLVWQATDSTEYEGVGGTCEPEVQGWGGQCGSQSISNIGMCVTTC